jgi:hypothetical protein
MSGDLSFIFDCPIICKTSKYIDESNNSILGGVRDFKIKVGPSLIGRLKI